MRYLRRGLGLAGALLLLLASLLFLADTRLGHHWVARSVSALTPANGLRIDVADIDGSLYGAAQIKGLRLSDPHGVFFAAPQVDLVWSPFAWFANRLDITRLHAPRATWYRLPKLRPAFLVVINGHLCFGHLRKGIALIAQRRLQRDFGLCHPIRKNGIRALHRKQTAQSGVGL